MHPSLSVNLEPGLDRGVPWGCDLYTFVSSAAGHMMRTLQKPRKNRPSKRQVNHRRFLHNMIQRKFADIEAANHRLASALYLKEEGKDGSKPSPEGVDAVERTPVPQGQAKSRPPEAPAPWGEGEEARREETRSPAGVTSTSSLGCPERVPGAPPDAQLDPGLPEFARSDPLEVSLLEACDFPVQMLPDVPACVDDQKGAADILESQWSEIMELLGAGGFDSCACRGDGGQEAGSEFGFSDFPDGFTECPAKTGFEGGRFGGSEECEHVFEDGGETEDGFRAAFGYQGDRPEQPREEGCCMLGSGLDFPTFQGVAQSFTVPLQYDKPRSIPTPPHEEEWPFTDILEDGAAAFD